jgi:hypothetical protein
MKITEAWCKNTLKNIAFLGPHPKDYAAVDLAVYWVHHHISNPQAWFEQVVVTPHRKYVDQRNAAAKPQDRKAYDLLLHVWNKAEYGTLSCGYNGDGSLLQKMYDCLAIPDVDRAGHVKAKRTKSLWDHYFSARLEMLALQFRREIFETQLAKFITHGATSLVDLGCGNGNYTRYAYDYMKAQGLFGETHVVGVDQYPPGITAFGPRFIQMNVVQALPPGQFDIVYSSGLFDYFTDTLFKRMLRRIKKLKPKFIMIGNIEQTPHTRALMCCLNWKIFDRSRWDL